jgi:hypothetical protein
MLIDFAMIFAHAHNDEEFGQYESAVALTATAILVLGPGFNCWFRSMLVLSILDGVGWRELSGRRMCLFAT